MTPMKGRQAAPADVSGAEGAMTPMKGRQAAESRTGVLSISEIFTSIQGEGLRTGMPSTFVRLLGCNLSCAWCDTPYTWKEGVKDIGREMAPEAIARAIVTPDVVLTGGEPMLQDLAPLLELLGDRHVTIETNATVFKAYDRVDLWSLSPKLGSSGHRPNQRAIGEFLAAYGSRLQLKFVVGNEADLAAVRALLAELPEVAERSVPVILQPVGTPTMSQASYLDALRALVDSVLAEPSWNAYALRTLPQLHRLLWGDQRGI